MVKEHPTGTFLDLANRLEVKDAWFHIMERGGLINEGAHPCESSATLEPLYQKLRLHQDRSSSYEKCRVVEFSVLGWRSLGGYPFQITLVIMDGFSHAVNIHYFTPRLGHVSVQTNLFALEEQLNSELQKVVLTRIGTMYGI